LPLPSLKQIQNTATIVSLKVFLRAFQCLPRWCTQALFTALFPIAYFGIRHLAKICQKNLYLAYGEIKTLQEYQKMTRDCFYNMGCSMMDMLYFVKRPQQLKGITHLHGEEHLRQALAKNHGAVVVTAHLSNFPLMFLSLVSQGYKVNVVIRTMRNRDFSKFMYDLCALWGIRMIETFPQKSFIKESFAALRRNELLVILLDEVVPAEEGVLVPFFGTEVTRGMGPMLFYERVGSPSIPILIAQDEKKNFQIFIEPELKVETRFSPAENMKTNVAHLTKTIESYIRRYPSQWGGWLNKRWAAQHVSAAASSQAVLAEK